MDHLWRASRPDVQQLDIVTADAAIHGLPLTITQPADVTCSLLQVDTLHDPNSGVCQEQIALGIMACMGYGQRTSLVKHKGNACVWATPSK